MSQKYFNFNCKNFEDLELFSKTPELYFKGRSQKSALIGRVFTVIYAILYAAYFIYKVIRMFLKIDVSFYETETFIGETIYYPVAMFRIGKKIDNEWQWETRMLGTEQCKI